MLTTTAGIVVAPTGKHVTPDAPLMTSGGSPSVAPQAGMGVASFVIAIISGASVVLLLIVAYVFMVTPGVVENAAAAADEETPINYLIGTWGFATSVLSLVGIVFGIGGVLQKGRRRTLAVAGLVLNVALPIGLMFVIVLGMTLNDAPASPRGKAATAARDHSVAGARPAPGARPGDSIGTFGVRSMGAAVVVAALVVLRRYWQSRDDTPPVSAGPQLPPITAISTTTISPVVPPTLPPMSRASECARCKKAVPVEATYCTRCGHPMSFGQPAAAAASATC